MKTVIKALFLLLVAFACLCSCAGKQETKEYNVTYRIYYTSTDIKTETFRTSLGGNRRGYDLHLDSCRGSNSIIITRHNSIGVTVRVISTTAPIEIIEYSNNFVKTYGVGSKLQ